MDRHGVAWMIAGTAGEGLESGGEAFSRALASAGYRPTTQRDFPSRIRGGDTTFTVRLTAEGRLCPPTTIDLALAFNDTVLPRIDARLDDGSLLLLDEGVGDFVSTTGARVVSFPFTSLAEQAGNKRAKNVVALGVSTALLGIDLAQVSSSVAAQFARKGEEVVAQNLRALQLGFQGAQEHLAGMRFAAPEPESGGALFLSGNEAAALGALAAGCRIAAAYPITPASDVLEYLTPRLQQLGGAALQMEDEMAALNACIGAGFTGAKAVTATSGPGLALMTETIGLAGSTETPVVVLDCQRPGPSTGMPTKHGQDDLWHMVHGGAGEFVRVVVAPMNVEDAFYATSEAFRLADYFRCPAFVALDQQCSLFKQTVPPFDAEAEAARHGVRPSVNAEAGSNAWDHTYQPYGGDGSGRQLASLPGEPGGIYYSNSTEHAPSGFTNENPKVRVDMVNRRLRRMQAIVEEAHQPIVVDGPEDAELILVSWGSTVEAIREAADRLRAAGTSVRTVAVRLLWPFPRQAFQAAVGGQAPIVVAEANATAQLARLIRSELPLHDRIREALRYDGIPLSSDDVLSVAQPQEVAQ